MKKILVFALLLSFAFSGVAFAKTSEYALGIVPENRHALELSDGSAADRHALAAKVVG